MRGLHCKCKAALCSARAGWKPPPGRATRPRKGWQPKMSDSYPIPTPDVRDDCSSPSSCSATINWFCPACGQWFQTLQMRTESRVQSKVRIRADHIRKGCSAYSPKAKLRDTNIITPPRWRQRTVQGLSPQNRPTRHGYEAIALDCNCEDGPCGAGRLTEMHKLDLGST